MAPIDEKLVQHQLGWFGNIQRMPPEVPVRSGDLQRDINGKRGRGQPNLTSDEAIERPKGMKYLQGSRYRYECLESSNQRVRVVIFSYSICNSTFDLVPCVFLLFLSLMNFISNIS